MLNLTEEQIDRAAEASYLAQVSNTGLAVFTDHSWTMIDSRSRNIVRDGVRAAAPFLQAPIDRITDSELEQCCGTVFDSGVTRLIIETFIDIRNANLVSSSADPRREKITSIIARYGSQINNGRTPLDPMVDAILAALDAKEL